MNCPACGAYNSDSSHYCEACGAKLIAKKYCRHCGALLTGMESVCPNCGKNLGEKQPPVIAQNLQKQSAERKRLPLLASIGALAIVVALMLFKWVIVRAPFGLWEGRYSIFQLVRFAKDLYEYCDIELTWIIVAGYVIIGASALCLLFLMSIIYDAIDMDRQIYSHIIWAFICCTALSVGVMLCVLLVNNAIQEESAGLLNGVLSLTVAPYALAVFSILGAVKGGDLIRRLT